MTLTREETEKIATALFHYHRNRYRRITDYYKVITQRTEVAEGIYKYPCPVQDIYLDEECYAVEHGKQHVIKYYYDENDEIIVDQNGHLVEDLEEGEYAYMEGEVYYDFRKEDEIPEVPDGYDGDGSLINVFTLVGDYEWKRSTAGGGGVVG